LRFNGTDVADSFCALIVGTFDPELAAVIITDVETGFMEILSLPLAVDTLPGNVLPSGERNKLPLSDVTSMAGTKALPTT
jgi:hypothetical protein